MKKGLVPLVVALTAGALSFGCQKADYQKVQSTPSKMPSQRGEGSNLEQYFFQAEELKSTVPYLGKVQYEEETLDSLKIISGEALKETRFRNEAANLERAGSGVYTLPSGTKILLTVKEYKSEELASQAEVSKNYGQVTSSPFMVQKGRFLISTDNMGEVLYEGEGAIDSKDKTEFARIWKDYIKRTGGEPNLEIDKDGNVIHTGLNKSLASKVEDRAFEQVVREQESSSIDPNDPDYWAKVMADRPKDGQEDFFSAPNETEKKEESTYTENSGDSNDWVKAIEDNTLGQSTTYAVESQTNSGLENKNNLDKYFLNLEKNTDLTMIGDYPGLQPWMNEKGIEGYELRKYRFENSSWESLGIAVFDYAKEKEKKVYDYHFSPLKDYGFILKDGKFAYFNFSSFGNNPQINKEYLTAIVNYQKENNAKLYFSYEGKDIKISPEEYMKRLDVLVQDYSKNDYWNERGESEIKKQLFR